MGRAASRCSQGEALLCGFYLNELLLQLLPRDDPHEALFDDYGDALRRALAPGEPTAPVLRAFEKRLLRELGYALPLEREAASGAPIEPDAPLRATSRSAARCRVDGAVGTDDGSSVSGADAARHRARRLQPARRRCDEAKQLMRMLIGHRLDGQALHTPRGLLQS